MGLVAINFFILKMTGEGYIAEIYKTINGVGRIDRKKISYSQNISDQRHSERNPILALR